MRGIHLLAVAGAALTLFSSGCVILPLPHTSPAGPDVKGQIVDARSRRPLAGAKVSMEGRRRSVVTKADGTFTVSSGSNFHLIYYANPSWSLGFPPGSYYQAMLVEKEGYRPFRIDFHHGYQQYQQYLLRTDRDDLPDRRLERTTYYLKAIPLSPAK